MGVTTSARVPKIILYRRDRLCYGGLPQGNCGGIPPAENEWNREMFFPAGSESIFSGHARSGKPADRARNYAWYDKMLVEELAPWAMHETGVGKVADPQLVNAS